MASRASRPHFRTGRDSFRRPSWLTTASMVRKPESLLPVKYFYTETNFFSVSSVVK